MCASDVDAVLPADRFVSAPRLQLYGGPVDGHVPEEPDQELQAPEPRYVVTRAQGPGASAVIEPTLLAGGAGKIQAHMRIRMAHFVR